MRLGWIIRVVNSLNFLALSSLSFLLALSGQVLEILFLQNRPIVLLELINLCRSSRSRLSVIRVSSFLILSLLQLRLDTSSELIFHHISQLHSSTGMVGIGLVSQVADLLVGEGGAVWSLDLFDLLLLPILLGQVLSLQILADVSLFVSDHRVSGVAFEFKA